MEDALGSGANATFRPLDSGLLKLHRAVRVTPDRLVIVDRWEGGPTKGQPAVGFLLPETVWSRSGQQLAVETGNVERWVLDCDCEYTISTAHCFARYGEALPAYRVDVRPQRTGNAWQSTITIGLGPAADMSSITAGLIWS